VKSLFVSSHPKHGLYQIRVFVDNNWKIVTIDDKLPVNQRGSLVFGSCRNLGY
jgi:hypothetical protein